MNATILRVEDFTTEARIPGLHEPDLANPANQDFLEWVNEYCTKYEEDFCTRFFPNMQDYRLLVEYAESGRDDIEETNNRLRMLRYSLSRYVAFFINRVQVNATIGTVILESENGHRTDNRDLQCKLWNDMVDSNRRLFSTAYPGQCVPDNARGLFEYVNRYGI